MGSNSGTDKNDQQQQQQQQQRRKNSSVNLPRRRSTIRLPSTNPQDDEFIENLSGIFRGIAAATRKAAFAAKKVLVAKGPASAKQTVRAIGDNRPLAFASEGAVAGEALLPKAIYYSAWGLSGLAITADIYNKYDDAPTPLKFNTALYWTTFHIPASLVVPAVIIHQIVHTTETILENPKSFINKQILPNMSQRTKALLPVGAAILSIIPVVPTVDYLAESIMEPTLGTYLGLSFEHEHHDNGNDNNNKED